MSVTLIAAKGYTLPTGASLTLSAAGAAPGMTVALYDATGTRTWARVTRSWADGTNGAITVECDSGAPPPPPPP